MHKIFIELIAHKKSRERQLPACESTTLNMLFPFPQQQATQTQQGQGSGLGNDGPGDAG